MNTREDFIRRFKRFQKDFGLHPNSYQIRNSDGTPGGWIAMVGIWDNRNLEESIVKQLYQVEPEKYGSKDEADGVALWMGLRWLEDNVDEDL
jgi:hypothetical protein